ncbi:universal stress protein [Sphingobacterium cavernae]|uniref:universal stress protein n=1 Tax=Sphingobacterium cavernae TaxID=2592657 RepID=UPI00122FD8EB|nr:universal stress protein [Sphingobacterium cavernae]
MRRTLLVPTDFSNNAFVATTYALGLARLLNADVHIIHAYRPLYSAFQSQLANETDAQRAGIEAQKRMTDFLEKLDNAGKVQIRTSIVRDHLKEALHTYLLSDDTVSFIVMGTHGASGQRKDLLGSNTYDVAKTIQIPLLIIPEYTKGFNLEHAVFFTDYQKDDVLILKAMMELYDACCPSCTMVHIAEHLSEEGKTRLDNWKDKLVEESGYSRSVETSLVEDKENIDTVNTLIDQLQADLCLLTLVGGRNFFEKLFHKSLARAIILNPEVPVLLTATR